MYFKLSLAVSAESVLDLNLNSYIRKKLTLTTDQKWIREEAGYILTPNILTTVISAWTFHHMNISARVYFASTNIPAQGHFDMETFWHRDCAKNVLLC